MEPRKYDFNDSGERDEFESGAVRDTQGDKRRYDLIPLNPLFRLSEVYRKGAIKYGENNYQKGMSFKRVYASLLRHVFAWAEGRADEDHLAHAAWNMFTLMEYEMAVEEGELPKSLADMGPLYGPWQTRGNQ